jgi:hypothetical protein
MRACFVVSSGAVNSNLHPMVATFLSLGNERIIERYCHLNPSVSVSALTKLLTTPPRYFRWSGADLFNVTNLKGKRQMIVVETNSCPSGQKSMPMVNNENEEDGYHVLMRTSFKTMLDEREASEAKVPVGGLAVIYDKNPMEANGYAAAMADVFKEPVYLAELYVKEKDPDPPVRWQDEVMQVRDAAGDWIPIRACFRYVTQRPWDRIPMNSKTLILNSIISCLAGGRNKMAADKAYEFLNNELGEWRECGSGSAVYSRFASSIAFSLATFVAFLPADTGLEIRTPETIRDVSKNEVPIWVKSMGGHAVVKVPYSNAGQGVYTITSPEELQAFMKEDQRYSKYIVQSLVGNSTWSSVQRGGAFFHCGLLPNKRKQTFVSDLRCMVSATKDGFQPLAVYARRAMLPLVAKLSPGMDSWGMLGTNLSVKKENGEWETDTSRLLLMDMKDFNRLGIAIDDLIDAYVQTCLSTLAIDRMAMRLMKKNGIFDRELYSSLNQDEGLLKEIMTFEEPEPNSNHLRVPTMHSGGSMSSPPMLSTHMSPISLARLNDASNVLLPSPLR